MLILGIDPGTATTGYGFIKVNGGVELEVVEYGLIETKNGKTPTTRLNEIYKKLLDDILVTNQPDVMAIEKLFFARNAKTAMRVSQAVGVLMLSAAHAGIPVVEYAPGMIKKEVTGSGRADKLMIQKSVRTYLGAGIRKKKGEKTHFDNAADALAVALCHLIRQGIINK